MYVLRCSLKYLCHTVAQLFLLLLLLIVPIVRKKYFPKMQFNPSLLKQEWY